jgi:hypothetical protein
MLSPCTRRQTPRLFRVNVLALRVIDSLVLRQPPILLLGRICIGSLYSMSGINHWRGPDTADSFHDGSARFGACLGDGGGDY